MALLKIATAWLQSLYKENFQVLAPGAHIAKDVRAAKLDIAIQESRLHFVGAIASVSFCFWVFYSSSQPFLGFIWWGCAIPLLLANYIMQWHIYRYHRNRLSLAQWEWVVFLMYAGWGALWAFAPWLFLPGIENPYVIMIMLLTLIAISVTVIIAASVYPASYMVLALPILLSAHLYLMKMDLGAMSDRQQITMNWLVPFFTVFLTLYMLKLRKTMLANTVLRLENEQANLNKSQFLAAASHDIRQPLQASNFYWESLRAEYGGSELLDKLGQCLGSLSDLLDNLLDISRLDAQAVSCNPQHVELSAILASVSRNFAPLAIKKGIEFQAPETGCCVYADPILLERVLFNLMSNAIAYTREGQVQISCKPLNDSLMLAVEDTGIGIPGNEQQAVFEEFYQLDNPERDRKKGLGLGLSIVRRICDLMGFRLQLESSCGSGSRFVIYIPLGNPDLVKREVVSSGLDENQLFVLLIDDEEMIRDSLRTMLARWKIKCEAFSSEEEATGFICSRPEWIPDCIVSDYRLKDHKTGKDAIASLTTLLKKDIPAILLTGDTHPERIKEAHKSGYTVVHKPVKPAYLRTAINLVTS